MDLTLSAIKITSWLLVWLWLCLLTACHKKVLWCRRQCPKRGREREGGREQHRAGGAPAGAPSLRLFCCMPRSLTRFVLELWLYYLDLRLHFSPPLLPPPASSSESATSCGRQRIKYRARYRGGRGVRPTQVCCGSWSYVFRLLLGVVTDNFGLIFYLH